MDERRLWGRRLTRRDFLVPGAAARLTLTGCGGGWAENDLGVQGQRGGGDGKTYG